MEKTDGDDKLEVMTFDEIVALPDYQAEFDRRIAKANETAVENAKKKWNLEQQVKDAEAQKLAKMDEEQKHSYEVEQIKAEREKAIAELNAYKLKDEAIKQASAKGIDLELMDTLDYTKETAETVSKKIEVFEKTSQKIHEKAIADYSKEPTPQVGENVNNQKSLNDCKTYEDFAKYYETHES